MLYAQVDTAAHYFADGKLQTLIRVSDEASLMIDRSVLSGRGFAQGISGTDGARISLNASVLAKCTANADGGALALSHSHAHIQDSIIGQCRARLNGGTVFAYHSSLMVKNVHVVNGTAAQDGGAFYLKGRSRAIITRSVIDGGKAAGSDRAISDGSGGGIYVEDSDLTLTNSTVVRSSAGDRGGAMCVMNGGNVQVRRVIFEHNMVTNSLRPNQQNALGGALYTGGGYVNVTHSRFVRNRASSGGSILVFVRFPQSRVMRVTASIGAFSMQLVSFNRARLFW